MSARDVKRQAVYDAEQLVRAMFDQADRSGNRVVEVLGSHITVPVERHFATIESIATYAEKLLALNWIRARWPRSAVSLVVRPRAGATAAHYEHDTATLAVPMSQRWALRELVILHEIAHHLDEHPDRLPAHGPQFCARYLDLVDGVIGPEAAFLLRTSLLDCGISA